MWKYHHRIEDREKYALSPSHITTIFVQQQLEYMKCQAEKKNLKCHFCFVLGDGGRIHKHTIKSKHLSTKWSKKKNSVLLDATITQAQTHTHYRRNMHHQRWIGQMFMLFIVDPIELHTFVSFFFSTKTNSRK